MMLADSVRRLLARHDGVPAHAGYASIAPAQDLGAAYVAAGFTHALAGETEEDSRAALRDAAAILRESAQHAVALPLAESMLANWLAREAGWAPESALCSVALATSGPLLTLASDAMAVQPATLACVPWGRSPGAVYALARHAAGCRIVRIDGPTPVVREGMNLAGEPRDALRVDDDAARAARIGSARCDPLAVLALAALLRSAQMVGAMERTLDLALDHARTRTQFGRAIGSFQAVQQMLAQHANHVAAASAAVDLGVDSWGTEEAILNAAIAKSRAGEAAGVAAECAHQVIAAMGYAMEHPLQRATRRLWSWRDDYGNEAFWNALIGGRFLAQPAHDAWPLLVDRPPPPIADR